MHPSFGPEPPKRLPSVPSLRLAELRSRVGQCDGWHRAVSIRDPISTLKRRRPHVNRATFKLHEIVARLFRDKEHPRTAAFLAEAPGGFLYCARQVWKAGCECYAMSRTNAIAFSQPDDPAILKDLPCEGNLLRPEVGAALLERCGAAAMEFVSADGGAEVPDLDAEEQHSTPLVLAQAAVGLTLQAKGGCLVLKVFEGCTLVTRQLFETLRSLYATVMLFKPLSSKVCNSERYVVAMGLHSTLWAAEVAKALQGAATEAAASGRFVQSLGREVSADTHGAFDRMAEEQANGIEHLLLCADRVSVGPLRDAAALEARQIEALYDAYAEEGGASAKRPRRVARGENPPPREKRQARDGGTLP